MYSLNQKKISQVDDDYDLDEEVYGPHPKPIQQFPDIRNVNKESESSEQSNVEQIGKDEFMTQTNVQQPPVQNDEGSNKRDTKQSEKLEARQSKESKVPANYNWPTPEYLRAFAAVTLRPGQVQTFEGDKTFVRLDDAQLKVFLSPVVTLISLFTDCPIQTAEKGDAWDGRLYEHFKGETLLLDIMNQLAKLEWTSEMVPRSRDEKFENQFLYSAWSNIRCQKNFECQLLKHVKFMLGHAMVMITCPEQRDDLKRFDDQSRVNIPRPKKKMTPEQRLLPTQKKRNFFTEFANEALA